jgi:hypothetical protein
VIDSACSSCRDSETYFLLKFLTGVYRWRNFECDKCINLCLWNSVILKSGKGVFIFQDPHAIILISEGTHSEERNERVPDGGGP